MATTTEQQFSSSRRKALFTAVSCLCTEMGFEAADKAALETLTEMLQSCLSEIGRSARSFCELAGRTEGIVGDVVMATVEAGLPLDALKTYMKRSNRMTLPQLTIINQTAMPKILQAGVKRNHPPHIPEHLPPFPDPHAYIRTATYKQPVTEYEAIREKAASQKRDVETALTRFIAKTGETQTLFNDETNLFPLIACKPMPHPYLQSLLPKDLTIDEDFEPVKEASPSPKRPKTAENVSGDETPADPTAAVAVAAAAAAAVAAGAATVQRKDPAATEPDPDAIDNPYLRPIKMPRKKRR